MNEDGWIAMLGDSWVAKVLGTLLMVAMGALGGWWTSRANIMNAVNEQVKTLMSHYVSEIDRLTKAHHGCEERMDQLEGEVRQQKQIIASMKEVGKQ